jgi:hypothetical protein
VKFLNHLSNGATYPYDNRMTIIVRLLLKLLRPSSLRLPRLTFVLLVGATSGASAYLTVNETAEILPQNSYRLGVAPQLLLSSGGGLNVGVFADTGVFQDADARIAFGAGTTDFWTMATLKWSPIPDVGRQPAMGIRTGLGYARDESKDYTQIQLAPIFSKTASTRWGKMVPYASIPITWIKYSSTSEVASQFTLGSEWYLYEDKPFGAELNLNMNNSVSSLSVYFSFPFDSSTGYLRK